MNEGVLRRLLNKSLVATTTVQQNNGPVHRFFLLETLRAYALEQLAQHGEQAAFAQHAAYFLALAEEAANQMTGKAKVEWLDQLDIELDNLRAAFHWLLVHTPAQAVALAGALKEFWVLRGYYQEGRDWLTQALSHPAPAPFRARALLAAGQLANRQGDSAFGLTLVEESIGLYRQLGDIWAVADALRLCGWVHDELHQRARKIAAFEESLALFRQLGDGAKTATLLVTLVYAYGSQQLGYAQATAYLQESIALLQTGGDSEALLFALTVQQDLEIQFGNYGTAAVLCAQSLTMARTADFKRHTAWALIRSGEIKRHLGEPASAMCDLEEALQLSQQLGDKDALMAAWRTLGDARRSGHEYKAACQAYRQALNLCLETNNRHQTIHCLIGCAALAIWQNDVERAAQLLVTAQTWIETLPPFLAVGDRTELADLSAYIQRALAPETLIVAAAAGQVWSFTEAVAKAQAFCAAH